MNRTEFSVVLLFTLVEIRRGHRLVTGLPSNLPAPRLPVDLMTTPRFFMLHVACQSEQSRYEYSKQLELLMLWTYAPITAM